MLETKLIEECDMRDLKFSPLSRGSGREPSEEALITLGEREGEGGRERLDTMCTHAGLIDFRMEREKEGEGERKIGRKKALRSLKRR